MSGRQRFPGLVRPDRWAKRTTDRVGQHTLCSCPWRWQLRVALAGRHNAAYPGCEAGHTAPKRGQVWDRWLMVPRRLRCPVSGKGPRRQLRQVLGLRATATPLRQYWVRVSALTRAILLQKIRELPCFGP